MNWNNVSNINRSSNNIKTNIDNIYDNDNINKIKLLPTTDTDFWCPPTKANRFASAFIHCSTEAAFENFPADPRPNSNGRLKPLWSGTAAGADPYLTEKKVWLIFCLLRVKIKINVWC